MIVLTISILAKGEITNFISFNTDEEEDDLAGWIDTGIRGECFFISS
jgi:hypothetical protein